MLELTLTHDPIPVLLYSRPLAVGETTEPKPTNFGFGVTVSSPDERVRSGGLVAVWQTALFKTTYPEEAPKEEGDGEWRVLHTIVVPIREDDFIVSEGGKQTYMFNFVLPANLTMSRVTPWERIAHVVYVFALAPSPTYSVIPQIRPDYPDSPPPTPERRRSGLFDGLRKLSLGSASSGASSSKGSKGSRKRSMAEELDDDNEPPIPKISQPFITEAHKEIIVVATTDEPGQMHSLYVDKLVNVELGTIRLQANSDMVSHIWGIPDQIADTQFIVGAGFICCALLTDLHPMATLHAFRVTLTQKLVKSDQATEHVDRYTLYSRGRSYLLSRRSKPSEDSILWRGEGVRAIDAASGHNASESPGASDRVHIVCGPRMPSSTLGCRPTRHNFDPGLSTNTHSLEFTFFWSIYGQDEFGKPLPGHEEGIMRTTTIVTNPTLGACGFNAASVVVPDYGTASGQSVDLTACMLPYKPGTEPDSFTIRKDSWIEHDGRVQRARKPYDIKSFDLRQHQLDTNSLCVCFYPMAEDLRASAVPRVVGGELDLASFKPVEGGPACFAAEKQRREDAWWKRHKGERAAVPGFGHFLLERCLCEPYRREVEDGGVGMPIADPRERSRKVGELSWQARGR